MPSITSAELDALKGKIGRALTKRQPPTRKEREILKAILDYLALVPGVVAWRQNVGMQLWEKKDGGHYAARYGFPGMADIGGWRTMKALGPDCNCGATGIITHQHWINRATPLYVEVKRPDQHPTQEQAAFLKMVEQAGGIAIVARSVEDVRKGLGL